VVPRIHRCIVDVCDAEFQDEVTSMLLVCAAPKLTIPMQYVAATWYSFEPSGDVRPSSSYRSSYVGQFNPGLAGSYPSRLNCGMRCWSFPFSRWLQLISRMFISTHCFPVSLALIVSSFQPLIAPLISVISLSGSHDLISFVSCLVHPICGTVI
jgi:hypothetical protein